MPWFEEGGETGEAGGEGQIDGGGASLLAATFVLTLQVAPSDQGGGSGRCAGMQACSPVQHIPPHHASLAAQPGAAAAPGQPVPVRHGSMWARHAGGPRHAMTPHHTWV